MLDKSGMPKIFWGQFLAMLVHTWNRSQSKTMGGATLYQLWHGKILDMSHLRVWGCMAYVHTQKDKWSSLSSQMERCTFIGHPKVIKWWKFIIPKTQCTIVSECAEFNKTYFLYKSVDQDHIVPQKSVQLSEYEEDAINTKQLENITYQNTEPNQDISETEELGHEMNLPGEHESVEELTAIGSRLPTRERHPPCKWWKPWEPPQAGMDQGDALQTLHGNHMESLEAMLKQ